jgi:FAD/FMN-containing dehydrogenase
MHLNIAMEGYEHSPETQARFYEMVDPFVMQFCRENKGSVSAEHGIGYQKPHYLHYSKTNEMIGVMRQIKDVFDPNGILNPYKVLPSV